MGLFLYVVWDNVLNSLFYMCLSSFPSTTVFSLCIFLPPMSGWINCRCVGLFLGAVFCFTDLHIWFCANTMLLWLLYLCSMGYQSITFSEVRDGYTSSFLLFFLIRIGLAIQSLLWFHINFRIICSISVKNVLYFEKNCIKSVDCFG